MPAVRHYLPSSGSAAVSPAFQTYTHAMATRRPMLTVSGSTALATQTVAPDAADHTGAGDTGHVQFVSSDYVAGVIASGADMKFAIQGAEANGACNQSIQIWVGVYSSDGTTLLTTLLAKTVDDVELATSLTNRFWSGVTTAGHNFLASNGRIVVEFSTSGTVVSGGGINGHNASMRWGENGASGFLPEDNSTTTNTYNPWFEITFADPAVAIRQPLRVNQAVQRASVH